MNINNPDRAVDDIEAFDQLESEYRIISTELPDLAIDKQIIAAAHSELAEPKVRKLPQNSWWRRLSLSLSVAAAFSFMVVATHWFWPAPARILPGTSPAPVSFDIARDSLDKPEPQQRARRELPEYQPVVPLPQVRDTNQQVEELSSFETTQSRDLESLDGANASVRDGTGLGAPSLDHEPNRAARLNYPNSEIWAREIIELFKSGDYEAGRKEMVRFKRAHPSYPIDEQLETLRR